MGVRIIDLQLIYGIEGARARFEQLAAQLIRSKFPEAKGVRVQQGDGGVDTYIGGWAESGGIHVFQMKFFPAGLGDDQKKQIRESFKTCLANPRFTTAKWTLCLPVDLSNDEISWFDKWKAGVGKGTLTNEDIDWWGGTELEGLLFQRGNEGIRNAFFKEEYLAQIREMHSMLRGLVEDILPRLGEGSTIAIPSHASPYIRRTVLMLDSASRVERRDAVKALEQSGDLVSKNLLLEALHHPARDVRINAALALLSDERVWPQLVPGLLEAEQGQDEEYGRSFVALERIVGHAVSELLGALGDDRVYVRRNALRVLGKLKGLNAEVVPDLLPLLRDSDFEVRWFTADILGYIRAVGAVPELCKLLADSSPYVRKSAVVALGAIGLEDSISVLIDALSDTATDVQSAAMSALKGCGERVVPKLILTLDRDNAPLRSKVIGILGQLKCEEAVPRFVGALSDPDADVRRSAIGALSQMKVPNLTEKLAHALTDPDEGVRSSAASSLGTLGNGEAVPALTKALNDRFIVVRMHAARSLGILKDERANPALRVALRDEEKEVRDFALSALGEIASSSASPSALDMLKQTLFEEDALVSKTAIIDLLRAIGTEESLAILMEYRIIGE